MKLIKKMLAIMFAFMMVVGMGTKVNAKGDESTTGTITIDNAVNGQTYSIYKILELESYDKDNNLYSYKPVDAWKEFFQVGDAATRKGAGSNFVTIDENGYATWKSGADVKTFAKLALEYAKNKSITPSFTKQKEEIEILEFDTLELGYYLVNSTVGTLCSLDTTNSEVIITDKNEAPTVTKKVYNGENYSDHNNVSIGDTILFETTIEVKKGAQNYVLKDTMTDGLKLKEQLSPLINSPLHVETRNTAATISSTLKEKDENHQNDYDYTLEYADHYFKITFNNEYLKNHENEEYEIIISYSAILTDAAKIGKTEGNTNTTSLKYGDNLETNSSITHTYTFGIPVFKYTGIGKTPLAGAKFTLYTDKLCAADNALKFTLSNQKYRYDANGGSEILESLDKTGRVDIEGIKAGTYYLKEVEAPKGYNKLASPIKVEINDNGTLIVDGKSSDDNNLPISQVNVENKTGKLLPSTGGMGTTMIYMAGAILVIASGIVLVSKKRSKAK